MKKEIKKRLKKLINYINYHNYKYYVLNKPTITNYKYDKKLNKLIKLEKKYKFYYKNSPTQKFNKNIIIRKNFKIYKHKYKMFSINHVYNLKNLLLWKKKLDNKLNTTQKYNYISELKYDGIAISIIYKNGKLNNAVTRGNGRKGNIVLKNIFYIKNIPNYIKEIKNIKYFDIKGEIVYSKKNFNFLNKERKKQKKKKFSNPRNAVNGIMHNIRNHKIDILAKKKLSFMPYFIYTNSKKFNIKNNSQIKNIKFLKNFFFFQKKSYKLCKNKNYIIKYIKYWETNNKDKSIYPIDGIVVKLNDLNLQKQIKYNNIYHKWCIAYKFKDKKYITKLQSIYFTIGKSGIIVPIVKFKKIKISGTIVKKASLYNSNIFNKYKLSINNSILIKKSGNIIPKIIKNFDKRKHNQLKINFPLYCPSCKTLLKKKKKIIYCLNSYKCFKQKIEKFKHFISKNGMNIKIKNNILEKLLKSKKIKYISDLYKLKLYDLILYYSYKEAKRVLLEIENSKNNKFYNLFYSLCIPNIGIFISKKISKKYNNIYNILKDIKVNKFKINNIGIKIINNINFFFLQKRNIYIIKKLQKIGFKI